MTEEYCQCRRRELRSIKKKQQKFCTECGKKLQIYNTEKTLPVRKRTTRGRNNTYENILPENINRLQIPPRDRDSGEQQTSTIETLIGAEGLSPGRRINETDIQVRPEPDQQQEAIIQTPRERGNTHTHSRRNSCDLIRDIERNNLPRRNSLEILRGIQRTVQEQLYQTE